MANADPAGSSYVEESELSVALKLSGGLKRLPKWAALPPLLFLVALVSCRGIGEGDFRNPDEARHAHSGVFLLDWVREGDWRRPFESATRLYARYPAVCIPFYAPPFYHAFEALLYALIGPSIETARLTAVLFHLASVIALYALCRREVPALSWWTPILFASYPYVIYWSRHAMLETAATCGILVSTMAALRWGTSMSKAADLSQAPASVALARSSNRRDATLWLGAAIACLLIKQTTVFALVAQLVWLVFKASKPSIRFLGIGVGVLALGILVWMWASPYQWRALTETDWSWRLSSRHLLFYPRALPRFVGRSALILIGLGSIFLIPKWKVPLVSLFALEAAAFFAMMVSTSRETSRYVFVITPMLAFAGAAGVDGLGRIIRFGPLGWLIGLALVLPNLIGAALEPPARVTGRRQAAELVASLQGGDAVFFDGYGDGDFVFFSRLSDPKQRTVLRGIKMLHTYASYPWIESKAFVENEDQIEALLKRFGVRYLAIEDVEQYPTPAGDQLRQLVKRPSFRLVGQVPITQRGLAGLKARQVEVYEYLDSTSATATTLTLPLPGLGWNVTVPFPP